MTQTATLPHGWKKVKLSDIATPLTEKAGSRKFETLSISAGKGFVNQAKKFGRELSGEQYKNYTVLRRGDFSFNKGNSKKYPYGCIYLLRDREIAAVPNAFYSFRVEGQDGEFYEQFFMNGGLNHQLNRLINTGVRNDGLFNLYENDFYNCVVPLPPLREQRAIAEILTTQDHLIETKTRLIEAKKRQKLWLVQNLLTGNIRLPGFSGEWKRTVLEKIMCIETGSRNTEDKVNDGGFHFFVRSQQAERIDSYSYDCEAVLTAGDGAGTGKVFHYINGKFDAHQRVYVMTQFAGIIGKYFYYFLSSSFLKVVTKLTAKTSVDSVRRHMLADMPIYLPSVNEQASITSVLTAADREIELLIQESEQQKLVKKHLMQQLLTGKKRIKGAGFNDGI